MDLAPRLTNNHQIFIKLGEVVLNTTVSDDQWFGAAEQVLGPVPHLQAINTIYILAEQPDLLAESLIRNLLASLATAEASSQSSTLARFFFVLGHVAMKQLVLVEEIQKDRTSRPQEAPKAKGKKRSAIEEELGESGEQDAMEAEALQAKAENDIVYGNLIGQFVPLLQRVASQTEAVDSSLKSAAVLSLCKLMSVSEKFWYCSQFSHRSEENLQLLFTLLDREKDAAIRANIIIALGDMTSRFTNTLEPWMKHVYQILRDETPRVRKYALMVLTHLLLNDIIKPKGNIAEMALCLEDTEEGIVNLARRFFFSLSKKG